MPYMPPDVGKRVDFGQSTSSRIQCMSKQRLTQCVQFLILLDFLDFPITYVHVVYRTRAIISRCLYIF